MATTAFPSTAIFDSGATGRDLIQAADQAAARAAIGIDLSLFPILGSDNTFTGDCTFTETGYFSRDLQANNFYRDAGGDSNFYVVGGDGITDSAWISIEENKIVWKRSGVAPIPNDLTVGFDFATQPKLIFDGLNTTLTVRLFNSDRVQFTTTGTVFKSGIKFDLDNTYSVGEPSARVAAVNCYNGNFRTVNVEADGTVNFYKLGSSGATNREWFEWKYAPIAAAWHMRPKRAGTGTFQDFCILSSRFQNTYLAFRSGGSSLGIGFGDETSFNNDNITITQNQTLFGENCVPTSSAITANKTFGSATQRWPKVFSSILDTALINQETSSGSDPTTSEYPNDKDWGIHRNSTANTIYLACNIGGTIYKVALS